MRKPRLLGDGAAAYHVMSRVVDRRFVLGDEERRKFVSTMRKLATFSGVRILTYCVMSNHFHILVEVPEKDEMALAKQIDDAELVSRVRTLYGRTYADALEMELANACANGLHPLADSIRAKYLSRMCDLSAFVKGVKQRFTQWFNGRNRRKGTLWEDRFKSVLVEDTQDALLPMGAYIDLNPVRAGICDDPKDYRDCGYAEAVAGKKLARDGISRMLQAFDEAPAASLTPDSTSQSQQAGESPFPRPTWRKAGKAYRVLLFGSGEEQVSANGETVRRGIPAEKVAEALAKGHKLEPAEVIRCRVRYFCDGLVFGTADFVEGVFQSARNHFGPRRQTGPRKMKGAEWGDLRTMRDLRENVFGPS